MPHLLDLVISRKINPGKVFDQQIPLADIVHGYRSIDERKVVKTLPLG